MSRRSEQVACAGTCSLDKPGNMTTISGELCLWSKSSIFGNSGGGSVKGWLSRVTDKSTKRRLRETLMTDTPVQLACAKARGSGRCAPLPGQNHRGESRMRGLVGCAEAGSSQTALADLHQARNPPGRDSFRQRFSPTPRSPAQWTIAALATARHAESQDL